MPKLLCGLVLLFVATASVQADDPFASSEPTFPSTPMVTMESTQYVANRPWPDSDWLPNGFVANNASNSGYGQAGGAEGRVGSPYFYSPSAGAGHAGDTYSGDWNQGHGVMAPGMSSADCAGGHQAWHGGVTVADAGGKYYDGGVVSYGGGGGPAHSHNDNRYGRDANPIGVSGTDSGVYNRHFGPGFYRHSQSGHYRFPYYSYRRPWYFQGHPVWARDTNYAW